MGNAKQVAAKFVEAFNAHDGEQIRQLNGENAVFEAPGDVRVEGRDAATGYAMGWLNAFPDARLTVTNELVDGDWVVQEFSFVGTHEDTLPSPAGAIPATHKRLDGRAVQIFRVDGEAIEIARA